MENWTKEEFVSWIKFWAYKDFSKTAAHNQEIAKQIKRFDPEIAAQLEKAYDHEVQVIELCKKRMKG